MRSFFSYLLLCSCLLQSACKSSGKDNLQREWYLNDSPARYQGSSAEHIILRLYPEGTYTQFGAGTYATGKWQLNDKGSYLHLEQQAGNLSHQQEFLQIRQARSRSLVAGLFYDMPFSPSQQQTELSFTGWQNHSDSDPYHPGQHRWRIPPAHAETDAAIRKRVIQYLHFLQLVYRHAIDNDLESINDNWYPTPLQLFYANGVRLAYADELEDWNACFYDSAQAVKGYQVISGAFYDIQLKKGPSRFERNLDCLDQLLKHIEK